VSDTQAADILRPEEPEEEKPKAKLPTLNSALTILETDPQMQGKIWYDEFLARFLTGDPPREWTDADDLQIQLYMQRASRIHKIGREAVCGALHLIAHRNRKNCVKDWLNSLKWDKTPRVEMMFSDHFGAANTAYTQAVSKNFWVSMVARVFQPGSQVDTMIVLEGPQGTMKSSALRVIGGDWFTEQHESAMNPKAFAEIIQGKLLIEISEMDSFVRAEMTKVKQVITCVSDRFREPWAKHASDHPRQCIFAGTTNRDDWNRDETGARRFWPIKCNGMIDLEALKRNRTQYFAEAVALYKAKASWWITPEEETKREQDSRYHADVWAETITWFVTHDKFGDEWIERTEKIPAITIDTLLSEAVQVKRDRWTRSEQMRVAGILKRLGYTRKQKNDGSWHYVLRDGWLVP